MKITFPTLLTCLCVVSMRYDTHYLCFIQFFKQRIPSFSWYKRVSQQLLAKLLFQIHVSAQSFHMGSSSVSVWKKVDYLRHIFSYCWQISAIGHNSDFKRGYRIKLHHNCLNLASWFATWQKLLWIVLSFNHELIKNSFKVRGPDDPSESQLGISVI